MVHSGWTQEVSSSPLDRPLEFKAGLIYRWTCKQPLQFYLETLLFYAG
jgi:hypothetical protein